MRVASPRRVILGILSLTVAATAASAQEPVDTVQLAPIVITPSRRPAPLSRATEATTVVTGAELRLRNLDGVADALRDVPGAAVVRVGSAGGVTSLFLRGGNSNDVKVLVDGVPLNQSGGAYDFADLSTANVDRIEIVRGPASVVYGADAVSGVVQVVTRRGAGPARGTLTAEAGSFGSTVVDASAGAGTARAGISAGLRRMDGDGTYAFNSHYRNTTGSVRLDAAPDARTDLSLTGRYGDRAYRFPTDGTGAATDSNQVSNGRQLTLGLDAGRRLSPLWEARVALALHTGRDEFDDAPDGPADSTGFAFSSSREAFTARRSVDARVIATPGGAVALIAGATLEGEHERQTSLTTSNFGGGASTEPDSFDQSRVTRAAYLQASAEAAGRVTFDAGLRLDDNSAFGTFVTARGGATLRLGDTRIRATVGNAFKAPTFSEISAASPFEVGNPDLRPERTTSWDAGVEQRLPGGIGTLAATWFDQRFRDLIQYVSAAPGEPTYQNLAAARSHGLELVAALRHGIVGMTAQYSWISTRVTDAGAGDSPVFLAGASLIRRPAHSGRLGLAVEPRPWLRTFANMLVIGRRDDVDFRPFPAERVTLPAVVTVELAAEVDVVRARARSPGVGLRVRVENLFDRRYDAVVGFPGRRRAILAGVRAGL